MIAMVDYGMGNRRSVEKALEHVGADVARTADHEQIRAADGIVVPGDARSHPQQFLCAAT